MIAVGDFLQGLLNAEAARVSQAPGGVIIVVFPAGKPAMRQATHAGLLIVTDGIARFGRDKYDGAVGSLERLGMPGAHPDFRLGLILWPHPETARLAVFAQLHRAFFRAALEKRNLAFGTVHQLIQERGLDRARIEPGGREFVQQHVPRFDRAEHILPDLRDRAFAGEQGARAELECDLAKFGIVDPVVPFAQVPHPARHHDRHVLAHALGAHHRAQFLDARIGVLRLGRVFGVGKAIMPARQPRVFIDHRCHQFGHLVIAAFPQCAERPARTDDRQVGHIEPRRDFRQLVRHPRPAGDAGHHAAGVFQHAFEHSLRPAHFPQHVDVDRTLAACDFIGLFDLRGRAINGVADQFLMAFAARCAVIDLRNRVAVCVIAIGVDRADRADTARSRPRARTGMVGCRYAFAAFDQRPHFAPAIDDRAQSLEQ